MPNKPLRPCAHAGCNQLVRSGYCEKHQPKPQNQRGESAAWHGLYSTREWRELRENQLIHEPWCQNPRCRGTRRTPSRATVVDHVKPHRGDWAIFTDRTNLQSLCKSCHDRKTAIERAGKTPSRTGW